MPPVTPAVQEYVMANRKQRLLFLLVTFTVGFMVFLATSDYSFSLSFSAQSGPPIRFRQFTKPPTGKFFPTAAGDAGREEEEELMRVAVYTAGEGLIPDEFRVPGEPDQVLNVRPGQDLKEQVEGIFAGFQDGDYMDAGRKLPKEPMSDRTTEMPTPSALEPDTTTAPVPVPVPVEQTTEPTTEPTLPTIPTTELPATEPTTPTEPTEPTLTPEKTESVVPPELPSTPPPSSDDKGSGGDQEEAPATPTPPPRSVDKGAGGDQEEAPAPEELHQSEDIEVDILSDNGTDLITAPKVIPITDPTTPTAPQIPKQTPEEDASNGRSPTDTPKQTDTVLTPEPAALGDDELADVIF